MLRNVVVLAILLAVVVGMFSNSQQETAQVLSAEPASQVYMVMVKPGKLFVDGPGNQVLREEKIEIAAVVVQHFCMPVAQGRLEPWWRIRVATPPDPSLNTLALVPDEPGRLVGNLPGFEPCPYNLATLTSKNAAVAKPPTPSSSTTPTDTVGSSTPVSGTVIRNSPRKEGTQDEPSLVDYVLKNTWRSPQVIVIPTVLLIVGVFLIGLVEFRGRRTVRTGVALLASLFTSMVVFYATGFSATAAFLWVIIVMVVEETLMWVLRRQKNASESKIIRLERLLLAAERKELKALKQGKDDGSRMAKKIAKLQHELNTAKAELEQERQLNSALLGSP